MTAVSAGAFNGAGDWIWTDNFQVGAPVPGSAGATLAGVLTMPLMARRRIGQPVKALQDG